MKWYLLVAATGSAVAATAGWLVQPHRWRSVVTWCVLAMVYGAVVLSVVGYVLVYKISGATD